MKLCNNCQYLKKQKKMHLFTCINSKSGQREGFPHHKTRKACKLYKGRLPREATRFPLEPVLPDNARFIEDYYDRHRGKEIWILGCGWSLDHYPDDFFDDKITIAINWAFEAFPKCTYIMTSHNVIPDWLVDNQPEFLDKCILVVFPYYSEMMNWPRKEYGNAPIWMRTVHPSVPYRSINEATGDYKQMIKPVMERQPILYQALWTVPHCAITASIIFGAKKITLVGCSMKALKDRMHATRGGMDKHYSQFNREFSEVEQRGERGGFQIIQRGTSLLAELFKPYGIDIQRYYYKTGYEKIEPFSYWTEWG